MSKEKALVLFSGGLDSTTMIAYLQSQGYDVSAFGLDYGQKHRKEIESAKIIAKKLGVKYHLHKVQPFGTSSALTGSSEVPDGHYEDESMKITVVPNRNMIIIALATAYAIDNGITKIMYGAHYGDHAIYPDCRESFYEAMNYALNLCDYSKIELVAPFIRIRKDQIVSIGADLGVPYELTWSCYKGNEKHCGKCGTCQERIEAFKLAGIEDPTVYEIEA